MISPGQWHKLVPRGLAANLQFRRDLLLAAADKERLQRGLIEICRQDILFFINAFVWQYNPFGEDGQRVGPFITWRFQERAILDPVDEGRRYAGLLWCYEHKRSAVIEKSREMGASWLCLIVQAWLCMFHEDIQCLDISRSANAVDSKTKNSLFKKIAFLNEHLPRWMTGEIVENKMYFEFPKTRSEITGEASTGRSGSGGRASLCLVDEFPEITEAVKVRQNTASISNCRIFSGTHLGVGTEFYRMTVDSSMMNIPMHWTRHPDKNKGLYSYDQEKKKRRYWKYDPETDELVEIAGPEYQYPSGFNFIEDGHPTGGPHPGIRSPWYDQKVLDIGSTRGAAMELDMNATGSVKQCFDPLLIRELKLRYAREPDWTGALIHDEFGQPKELVESPGGHLKLWCKLREGKPEIAPYGAGADISGGTGATPSCFTITHGRTGQKVLELVDANIEPGDFGTLCVALCRLFQDEHGTAAGLAWEHHGPGTTFGKRVLELGFTNVFRRISEDKLGRPRMDTIGWNPMGRGKPDLIFSLIAALRNGDFQNPSEEALEECLAFKYDASGKMVHSAAISENDPSGANEMHGDRVIADGLSWKMVKEAGRLSVAATKKATVQAARPDPRTFDGRQQLWEEEQAMSEERWA